MDGRLSSLEASRDLSRTWLHADMDCFYAAVHEAENPQLVGSRLRCRDMQSMYYDNISGQRVGGWGGLRASAPVTAVASNIEGHFLKPIVVSVLPSLGHQLTVHMPEVT